VKNYIPTTAFMSLALILNATSASAFMMPTGQFPVIAIELIKPDNKPETLETPNSCGRESEPEETCDTDPDPSVDD
jgi:hypothetical protein